MYNLRLIPVQSQQKVNTTDTDTDTLSCTQALTHNIHRMRNGLKQIHARTLHTHSYICTCTCIARKLHTRNYDQVTALLNHCRLCY